MAPVGMHTAESGSGQQVAADPELRARTALPVALLGLNVWLAGVLWPLVATSEGVLAAYLAAGSCLLPLAAGAFLYLRGEQSLRARTFAAAAWLAAFPISCGAVMTAWPQASERALGAFGQVLLWLSLCVYGAAVARAFGLRSAAYAIPELSLSDAPASERPRPRRLRLLLIALCTGGAALLALIAPGIDALAPDADGATRAAAVLCAVVGAALGCTVVAVFLASGLRADAQANEPRLDTNLRAAWYLFLALLGGVTYYVVIQP
jgi:hypothetical protein